MIDKLKKIVGDAHVLTGDGAAPYSQDWFDRYHWTPLAVVRPATTEEVSAVMALAYSEGVPIVPISGNTSTSGHTKGEGALMISLARMNRIIEIRPTARTAIVEAGAIVEEVQNAVDAEGLFFPLSFGAKGTALIGGSLSTNAGGANVLRYGNVRTMCMGIEAVLPDGRVMNLMSELHKDNSGYDLRDLMIGAEGTLGLITKAVLRLMPKPKAFTTAFLGMSDLAAAQRLLARLQSASGGAVEAFECMPAVYLEHYKIKEPDARLPLADIHPYHILVELGAVSDHGCTEQGELLEAVLSEFMEAGDVADGLIAQNEHQRRQLWRMREMAAELQYIKLPVTDHDIAIPTHAYDAFFEGMDKRLAEIDPGAGQFWVSHLGDGNIHYNVYPTTDDPDIPSKVQEAVEDVAVELGGSFSAEHGIGVTELPSMARRKDPVALDVMRAIKGALDPKGLMNPGKVIPAA